MAARRVPALAFLAAFLVAFNVFSSHGADRPSPRRALGDLGTDATAHDDGSSRGSLTDAVGHVGGLGGWTRERGVFEELAARARRDGHPLDSRDPDTAVDANGRRRKRVVKRIVRKVRRKADGTTEVISEKEEHPTDVITNAHKASEGRGQRGEARTADAVSDADKVARARSSGLKIETRRVGNVLEPFVPAIAAAEGNKGVQILVRIVAAETEEVRPDAGCVIRFVIRFDVGLVRESQGAHRVRRRRREMGRNQHKAIAAGVPRRVRAPVG